MLDGVNLRNIELDVCSFHDVSCDGTCEEAADEFRHLDHRDVIEQAVDRHSECCEKKTHREHHDHFRVVKLRNSSGCMCFRFVVRIRL